MVAQSTKSIPQPWARSPRGAPSGHHSLGSSGAATPNSVNSSAPSFAIRDTGMFDKVSNPSLASSRTGSPRHAGCKAPEALTFGAFVQWISDIAWGVQDKGPAPRPGGNMMGQQRSSRPPSSSIDYAPSPRPGSMGTSPFNLASDQQTPGRTRSPTTKNYFYGMSGCNGDSVYSPGHSYSSYHQDNPYQYSQEDHIGLSAVQEDEPWRPPPESDANPYLYNPDDNGSASTSKNDDRNQQVIDELLKEVEDHPFADAAIPKGQTAEAMKAYRQDQTPRASSANATW